MSAETTIDRKRIEIPMRKKIEKNMQKIGRVSRADDDKNKEK